MGSAGSSVRPSRRPWVPCGLVQLRSKAWGSSRPAQADRRPGQRIGTPSRLLRKHSRRPWGIGAQFRPLHPCRHAIHALNRRWGSSHARRWSSGAAHRCFHGWRRWRSCRSCGPCCRSCCSCRRSTSRAGVSVAGARERGGGRHREGRCPMIAGKRAVGGLAARHGPKPPPPPAAPPACSPSLALHHLLPWLQASSRRRSSAPR